MLRDRAVVVVSTRWCCSLRPPPRWSGWYFGQREACDFACCGEAGGSAGTDCWHFLVEHSTCSPRQQVKADEGLSLEQWSFASLAHSDGRLTGTGGMPCTVIPPIHPAAGSADRRQKLQVGVGEEQPLRRLLTVGGCVNLFMYRG